MISSLRLNRFGIFFSNCKGAMETVSASLGIIPGFSLVLAEHKKVKVA